MKKLLGIVVLGLLLVGCASTTYAPGKNEQDALIKHGLIKIGMNGLDLVNILGGQNALTLLDTFGSETHMWVSPSQEIIGIGESYDFVLVHVSGELKLPKNYKLENFFLDPIETLDYMLPKIPDGKGKNELVKIYGTITGHENYKEWKKSQTETAKKPKKEKTTTDAETKAQATSGSAFFVSNTGYIITNFHVIETCNDNSKIFYKNNEIDAKLIAKDKLLDLALLKVEVSNNKFITISNKAPRKLQRIIAAGYPFGKYLSDDMKFTAGIVSSLKGLMDDSTRLQIDAALNPGNSGGPIVDENTGELVAVAVAGLRKDVTEAVNYGIKAGSVKNFLESNQIDPSTFPKKFSTGDIAKLLESTVLYTFCN